MSGLAEIKQWVKDNSSTLGLLDFTNVEDAYNRINDPKKEDWRNDLDDILLDQKSEFLDFLETQISQPFEPPEPDVIQVRAYSYINFKGTVVNVRSHTRKRK